MPGKRSAIIIPAVVCLVLAACQRQALSPADTAQLKLFAPLPVVVEGKAGPPAETQIELGRMLYYDVRLSKGQDVSCNSCHDLARYGVDGEATSEGFKKQHGNRNSPTVYNAAAHFAQFWDGRAADVEQQAKGPMLNPVEMAMPSGDAVVAVLKSMPEYVEAFSRAFPGQKDPVSFDNAAAAIAAFERKLLTPSRWDKFLKGDDSALTAEEKAGFHAFTQAGCQACHSAMLLGGNMYQRIGVMRPYPDTSDPGRFQVTRSESDRMSFKVPSLRNVEKTAPYFHNGKIATLEEAVAEMGNYQLGKQFSPAEVRAIVAFLKTLTGEIPAEYIKQPLLPKSTGKTPKPAVAD
ncbi:MAG: cytochrome c peroxidase [Bryobacteraceae bacterium]